MNKIYPGHLICVRPNHESGLTSMIKLYDDNKYSWIGQTYVGDDDPRICISIIETTHIAAVNIKNKAIIFVLTPNHTGWDHYEYYKTL